MTTQTSYSERIAAPPPGTIAGNMDNAKVVTGICETASPGIPFGRAVSYGTLSDEGAVLGGTVAGFRGVAVRDITVRGDNGSVDHYLPPNSMAILEGGDIWLEPAVAVNNGEIVTYNTTTGIFSNTGGSTIPGAYWKTSCGVGGRAIASFRPGRAA